MAGTSARLARLGRELAQLSSDPPPGVSCWAVNPDAVDRLAATLVGPPDTPYAEGHFRLDIAVRSCRRRFVAACDPPWPATDPAALSV